MVYLIVDGALINSLFNATFGIAVKLTRYDKYYAGTYHMLEKDCIVFSGILIVFDGHGRELLPSLSQGYRHTLSASSLCIQDAKLRLLGILRG